MPTRVARLRRAAASCMTVFVGLILAATTGAPVAVADGRDQLAQAIATTRGRFGMNTVPLTEILEPSSRRALTTIRLR